MSLSRDTPGFPGGGTPFLFDEKTGSAFRDPEVP
jgi:hypothetical protein